MLKKYPYKTPSRKQHSKLFAGVLLTAILTSSIGQAEVLPWLAEQISHDSSITDPLGTEKKAAGLVNQGLRPDHCPDVPDVTHPLAINMVVIAALCSNPATKSAYLSLLSQGDSFAGAYSGYFPSINATESASRSTSFLHSISGPYGTESESRSSGITGTMTLYDFGQREFRLESAELTLIAAGHSYNSSLQGLIASAMSASFQLLQSQNGVVVAHESEKYAKDILDATMLKRTIGMAPLADELQSQGSYSQALLSTEQAENQVLQSRASLAVLLGLSVDTVIELKDIDDKMLVNDPFNGKVQEFMQMAKEKRLDLLASRAQLEGSKLSLEAAKRSDLATISAGVNEGLSNGQKFNPLLRSTTRSQSFNISVSIPIFSGFTQSYNQSSAEKQLEGQQNQLHASELGVEQEVWNAWHNYETAKLSWKTSQELLKTATQLKNVALGRYKEGVGTILDVLSAQTQYTSALQSQIQSRYNLLSTRVDLVKAVGVLDLENIQQQQAEKTPGFISPPDNSGLPEPSDKYGSPDMIGPPDKNG